LDVFTHLQMTGEFMAKKETTGGFEASLARLEKIVAELEQGDIELEKSLKLYEEGAKLIELCRKQLGEAQLRIEKIRPKEGGGLATEPMEEKE
jgi:exodeoxyribonuclease VII small subunit